MQSNDTLQQSSEPLETIISTNGLASVPEEEQSGVESSSVASLKKPVMTIKRKTITHVPKFVSMSTASIIPVTDVKPLMSPQSSTLSTTTMPQESSTLSVTNVTQRPVRFPPPLPQQVRTVQIDNLTLSYQQQRDAFVKAYRALRAAQSGFFKTDWVKQNNIEKLNPQDAIALIIKHSQKRGSRTNKAWEIVQNNKGSFTNTALNEIYRYSFQHSGFFGIFKRSFAAGKAIYRNKTLQEKLITIDFSQEQPEGSRREKIVKMMR